MPTKLFKTIMHAKCILSGEHAVLRGKPAIIFPVKTKSLQLSYEPFADLQSDFKSPYGESFRLFFWEVIKAGLALLDKSDQKITGHFSLTNNIPMGCGLGFSSAICAAIAKWFQWQGWLEQDQLFNFARELENNFHGKSSGVDIAGVLADQAALYTIDDGVKPLSLAWQPHLYISPSGATSSTASCIQQVEAWRKSNPALACETDQAMDSSVLLATAALAEQNATKGLLSLTEAISKACHCFQEWGLITPKLQEHMDFLRDHGAIAMKPTGSGAGGYVLSLWEKPAPNLAGMIAVFD